MKAPGHKSDRQQPPTRVTSGQKAECTHLKLAQKHVGLRPYFKRKGGANHTIEIDEENQRKVLELQSFITSTVDDIDTESRMYKKIRRRDQP